MTPEQLTSLFAFLGISDQPVAPDENDCLKWPLGKTKAGYGMTYTPEKDYAHRTAWSWAHGPIPDGYHVDHVWKRGCRSRACFNLDHLEAVPPEVNAARSRKAHKGIPLKCGHPSAPDNRKKNGRCKICHCEREQERRATKPPSRMHQRVTLVRELLPSGLSRREIAQEVGCSIETVRRIELGITGSRVA